MLGGYMGLRNTEIREARYSNIHGDRLTVYGKGHGKGKRADLKVPSAVMRAIDEWTECRRSSGIPDDEPDIIVPSLGRKRYRKMTQGGLVRLYQEISLRAGAHVTSHSLRRYFATSLYRAHVDLVDIKALMRHENVQTTVNCYIAVDRNRLDEIVENLAKI